jgi:hypothetical protein
MGGSDTHYCSGQEIRVGDHVTSADWSGIIVFVLASESYAPGYPAEEWSYLGRGFMVEFDRMGPVFYDVADGDLVLVQRSQ